jgi:hypothetical protein
MNILLKTKDHMLKTGIVFGTLPPRVFRPDVSGRRVGVRVAGSLLCVIFLQFNFSIHSSACLPPAVENSEPCP